MDGLLLAGDYVVTGAEEEPIRDGAVAVQGERVVEVGRASDLRSRFPDSTVLGGPGHVVMPGLIDAHQHGRGVTNIQRGVADDALEEWLILLRGLWPMDIYLSTKLAAVRLLRTGVTTIMHHHASTGALPYREEMEASLRAYTEAGIRVTFTLDLRDRNYYVYAADDQFLATLPLDLAQSVREQMPPRVLPHPSEVLGMLSELERDYGSSRVRFALGPQGGEWSSEGFLRDLAALAADRGLPIHIHLLESSRQRQFYSRTHGMTGAAWLSSLGLLGANTSLAHCVWLGDHDLDILGASGAVVVHNPASNLRLRNGIAPVLPMLRRGIPVALGMDGMSLSDRADYFADLRLCKVLHFDGEDHLETRDLWRMQYEGGARATFWGTEIGRLAPGSWADVTVIRISDDPIVAPLDPDWRPLDRVLRESRPDDVATVVVGGRIVLRDNRITTVDEGELREQIRAFAASADPAAIGRRRQLVARVAKALKRVYADWERPVCRSPFYEMNCRQVDGKA